MDIAEQTEKELLLQFKREDIRKEYIDFLSGKVSYNAGKTVQTRTRKPESWKKIPTQTPVDISEQKIWVWSDLHFGHKNIIDFSDRPFINIAEMDACLIDNFNNYVSPNDVSIWVGDITFYDEARSQQIVRRCNGYKILVVGNHDFDHGKLKDMAFDEVHISYVLPIDGVDLIFTHYPFFMEFPNINVHGHEHIAKTKTQFSHSLSHINVCCEYHQYKPLNITEIIRWSKSRIESYEESDRHAQW